MNEEEREIVKKFERLYLKDFNNEKITNEDRLSYIECVLMSNLIEKLQKENEELKIKNNAIKRESEAYAEQMIRLDIEKQDYFEKYRYNLQQNESLTKEFSNVIPVQKIKDKIEELNQYYKKEIYPNLYQWRDITITEHYDEMIELLQEIIGDK